MGFQAFSTIALSLLKVAVNIFTVQTVCVTQALLAHACCWADEAQGQTQP